jgi:hypothetical protein
MYCPQCGQERISESTSFCSRCGYLLTGTAELFKTGGVLKASDTESPRSRGLKQGLFMFLLVFVVAPILGMISVFGFGIVPWPMGIAIILLGVGGLLRIAYAMMFEPKDPIGVPTTKELDSARTSALPPIRDIPLADYARPSRFDPVTSEIPPSVTDSTTKLLEKDPDK